MSLAALFQGNGAAITLALVLVGNVWPLLFAMHACGMLACKA